MNEISATEYATWAEQMKMLRGRWTIDQIHNAAGDFLATYADRANPTKGCFVMARQSTVLAGRYAGAVENIGDADFQAYWTSNFASADQAYAVVMARIEP